MSGPTGRLRRTAVQVVVVALGLALGLGAMVLYRSQTADERTATTPSVAQFAFSSPAALPAVSAPADTDPSLGAEAEPADAEAALSAFLRAEAAASADVAWALLDADGRRQWTTSSAWSSARGERAPPTAFTVKASAPGSDPADVEVDVDVDRTPSLDRFRGLVAARSTEVWRVGNENGHWRVAARPVESRPVLAAEAGAPEAVRAWVDAMTACDQPGAARFQVETHLLGPADVATAPCRQKGTWTVGSPVAIDRGGDVQPLLAAYGQGAAAWARLVPVEGAGRRFWAEVAPVGEAWMVVGVAAG